MRQLGVHIESVKQPHMCILSCPLSAILIFTIKGMFVDTGDIAILVGLAFGVISILIALLAQRAEVRELRAEVREVRAEVVDQGNRLSERISESEREQARLEGVNSVLQQQTHTHEAADD